MTTENETVAPPVKAPAKRKPRKRAKPRAAKPAPVQSEKSELAGITAKDCPAACTPERCVISTVGVCAHPIKSAAGGFGPITTANRERARKLIKHQMIDAKG